MIILYIRNPDDGIATYNKVQVYKSASQNGVYDLLTTVDIDASTIADNVVGYTKVTDSVGTTSSWYKVRYFNSVSSAVSDYSVEFRGGTTELDSLIRMRMKDTNQNNYFFTDEEIENARKAAIRSLYPATWVDTTYSVTITEENKKLITLPQYVARVDTIKVYDSNGDMVAANYLGFYKVGNKLYPNDEFPVGYTFQIVITKPYKQVAEVPEEFFPYLIDIAEMELLHAMEMDRARYYKYTTSIRPEGGNIPSFNRIIERLDNSATKKLNKIRRVRETTEINLVG